MDNELKKVSWTYRQGLQPLFVELNLLTRHPEGKARERGVRGDTEVRFVKTQPSP